MRWTPGGESSNVEDRRGSSGMMGGGGMRFGLGGTIVLLVLSVVFHRNFFALLGGDNAADPNANGVVAAPAAGTVVKETPEEHKLVQFVSFVLDDAQQTWAKILPKSYNTQYQDAHLVLFRNATPTACGTGREAMGPFYCPRDGKVYIDLAFYDELQRRFGAPGDFAQAYVITHELGHHVQNLLGISDKVTEAMRANPDRANALSVKLELQADCFAGVWGHDTEQRRILDQGDVDEALGAAAAVGDDRIQRSQTGRINVDSFTHGSAAQRTQWFKRGLENGDPKACDTFAQ